MSYNGSGTFQINTSGQPVVAGTVISSTAFNALTADLATGLSTAITKDGQTTTTARIPFAAGINSSSATDSTSTSTGSIITSGGVGIAKALYVGTTANVAGAVTLQSTLGVTGVATFSAAPIYSSLTASSAVATDASKALVSVTNTGTGNNVLATSPTLVTPILGTPQSGTLTNATGLPLSTGVTGVLPEANGGTGTTTGYYGFKNRIINGAMVIDQRNAGAPITTSGGFPVDRFKFFKDTSAAVLTYQQSSTAPAGFTNSASMTVSTIGTVAAGEGNTFLQNIEGFNVADLGWGAAGAATVTLSFWVRSSVTGTFGGSLTNSGNSRAYPFTYTILSANTFEQKSITIAGDTTGTWNKTTGSGIIVWFSVGTGSTLSAAAGAWAAGNYISATGATNLVGTSGATWFITGVQLEKGSTATSFDYRPYPTEMALCQRYYWRTGGSQFGGAFMPSLLGVGVGTGASAVSLTIQNPVRFRVGASSITLGGSAVTYTPAPASVTTALTIDRATFDQTMMFIAGTGIVLGTAYRIVGNADATTFIEFLGMEL